MITETLLAITQGITEFLPISSSGHLAIISNIISQPNLFFFTILHLASLLAVIIYTRKEIWQLLTFKPETRKLWVYLIIATIPAALFGLFFNQTIEKAFSSYLFLSIAYLIIATILFLTKFTNQHSKLNSKNALIIGILQILALFPGISRSGMTISTGMFLGIPPKKAAKFSFLLLIPLALGAFILEASKATIAFNLSLIIPFIICVFVSLAALTILEKIILKKKFWLFSFYCLAISIISLILHLL